PPVAVTGKALSNRSRQRSEGGPVAGYQYPIGAQRELPAHAPDGRVVAELLLPFQARQPIADGQDAGRVAIDRPAAERLYLRPRRRVLRDALRYRDGGVGVGT